jgi:hypothetical protein
METDLNKFGARELKMASRLLEEYANGNCPEDFEQEGIYIAVNEESGNVFLVNDNLQIAMINVDKLETFYICCECGKEGFANEGFTSKDKELCDTCLKEKI